MQPRYDYYTYSKPPTGIRFGRVELLHILAATAALTLAFILLLLNITFAGLAGLRTDYVIGVVIASFVAVFTGFLMHELAHKIVAVRYGLWAEFRANMQGLMLAIVTAFFGIIIAAPGAVMIAGPVGLRQGGKISLAGPMTNLAFGGGFLGILAAVIFVNWTGPIVVFLIIYEIALVNLILGTFNMIPVLPLDGAKIWRWKKPIWIGVFATFVALLAVFFLILSPML